MNQSENSVFSASQRIASFPKNVWKFLSSENCEHAKVIYGHLVRRIIYLVLLIQSVRNDAIFTLQFPIKSFVIDLGFFDTQPQKILEI